MAERKERRKEQRKKLMAYTMVYDQQTKRQLGYIQDLTLQGMLVIGERMLDTDTQTTLAFELPGGLPGIITTHLSIAARVVRCEKDANSQTYKIGFEYIDLKMEQTEILRALLERYHFHQTVLGN